VYFIVSSFTTTVSCYHQMHMKSNEACDVLQLLLLECVCVYVCLYMAIIWNSNCNSVKKT